MNLTKLFETQKKLDECIIEEKGLQGQDLLDKKILALQVELGELANEWRGFKFWSKDQEPRIKDYKQMKCKWCNGSGDDGTGVCPDCKSSGDVYKEYNPLLEEYVDCLHFILSIGLELGMDEVADELDFEYAGRDIIDCFVDLNSDITDLYYIRENDDLNSYLHESLFSKFIRLGELLGFTWDEIEQAYFEKNAENHRRQEVGY